MGKRDDALADLVGALPSEYALVDENPVGSGGSSVVYRAMFRDRLPRALKVMVPRDDLRKSLELDRFRESYENEVEHLASLSHESVAKITDFGSLKLAGESYPFIATEFIEGVNLADFAADESVTGEDLREVLLQVVDALSYIHSQGVMHCDLKPDNVLVREVGFGARKQYRAVIVDLGAARLVQSGDGDELLYFYSTAEYVHQGLRLVLSNWTGNRIRRKDLAKYYPHQDMHSLGKLVMVLLGKSAVREKLRRDAGGYVEQTLVELSSRTLNVSTEKHVMQAFDFADRLRRVQPDTVSILRVPELNAVPAGGIVIPATGQRVALSSRANAIVSHPFFQRLHRLPQLDLLEYVLPGATHTRFVHALHTFDVFRTAVKFLSSNWQFRLDIERENIEQALLYALTAQLGHFHFLHMFEDFLAGASSTDKRIASAGIRGDSELLSLSMRGIDGGFPIVRDEKGRAIHDLVSDWGFEWKAAESLMTQPDTPVQQVLAGLMNSPIDAEKLSYLADDSRSTGLPFGKSIAGEPIFESLIIPRGAEAKSRGNKPLLGVRERSMSYLEHGVLARYWNIQTAYWNRANRAVQAMIKFQIRELIIAGELDFSAYLNETLFYSSDGALRWINAKFERALANGAIAKGTVNPVAPLLASSRSIYKRLLTISGKSTVIGREPDGRIFDNIRGRSALQESDVLRTIEDALCAIAPKISIAAGDLLLDLPRPAREEAGGQVLVYTDDGSQFMNELFTASPLLQSQRDAFELHVKRMRIFVSPRVYESLASRDLVEKAHDACLEALRSEWGK